jgi:hypothetical protein
MVRGRARVEASSPGAAMNKARRIADGNEDALFNRDEVCGRFEVLRVEVVKEEKRTP